MIVNLCGKIKSRTLKVLSRSLFTGRMLGKERAIKCISIGVTHLSWGIAQICALPFCSGSGHLKCYKYNNCFQVFFFNTSQNYDKNSPELDHYPLALIPGLK